MSVGVGVGVSVGVGVGVSVGVGVGVSVGVGVDVEVGVDVGVRVGVGVGVGGGNSIGMATRAPSTIAIRPAINNIPNPNFVPGDIFFSPGNVYGPLPEFTAR